jgi:hypothetical protein
MNDVFYLKSSTFRRVLFAAMIAVIGPTLGSGEALATTRLEASVASAAGAAAARAADRAVANGVRRSAPRYRFPACVAGARKFQLRGFAHAAFMNECLKVL